MTQIKIKSKPYTGDISYWRIAAAPGEWLVIDNKRGRLCETGSERAFLPFKIREIINIILDEFYIGKCLLYKKDI